MRTVFACVYPPQLVHCQGRHLAVDRAHNLGLALAMSAGAAGLIAFLALGIAGAALAQDPVGDEPASTKNTPLGPEGGPSKTMASSYQGRLVENGSPANGNYDFIINLYDNPTIGTALAGCSNAGTGSLLSQPVTNGVFTFYLLCQDWNPKVFTWGDR
jgi:hypothetical protein